MKQSFKWPWQIWRDAWNRWLNYDPKQEQEDQQWYKFMTGQIEALQSGTEIEPPWTVFRYSDPWCFNQGAEQGWMSAIWRPFWEHLTKEKQLAYIEKWDAPQSWRGLIPHLYPKSADE